jgi:hypothetical protein
LASHHEKSTALHGDINLLWNYWWPFEAKLVTATSLLHPINERQWSINDFWLWIIEKARAVPWQVPIIELSAAFQGYDWCDNTASMSQKWVSKKCEWLLALHLGKSKGSVATLSYNWTISRLPGYWLLRQHRYYVPMVSINRASTSFGLATWRIQWLCSNINPKLNNRPPFNAKMLSMTSSLCSKDGRQRSDHDFRPCIFETHGPVRLHWSLIELSASVLGQIAQDQIITMSQNERQPSIKDFWSCILHNLMAIERR